MRDSLSWSWKRCPTMWPVLFAALIITNGDPEDARAIFQAIKDMLQREVLDAQFAGIKQALESPDPEAMQRVKDMLADLNALLAAHARQEDTTDQFAEFHGAAWRILPRATGDGRGADRRAGAPGGRRDEADGIAQSRAAAAAWPTNESRTG